MDFKACFDAINESFPSALVSAHYKSRISAVASYIKSFTLASIECRLSKANDEVDLAIGFENSDQREWSSVFSEINNKAVEPLNDKSVVRSLQYFTQIAEKDFFLNESIHGFWLNFDLSPKSDIQIPWTYLVYREVKLGLIFYTTLLEKTLHVMGFVYDDSTIQCMQTCVMKLPEHAYLLGLATPDARNADAFRLVLYGMNFREITEYLKSIAWPGDVVELEQRLAHIGIQCDQIGLILDFSHGKVHAKIGLELLIHPNDALNHSRILLSGLAEIGICDEVKKNVLMRWLNQEHQPNDLNRKKTTVQSRPTIDPIRQWINHFKIVYDPGVSISAKCYFGVQPLY